jgi:hypothetical protein
MLDDKGALFIMDRDQLGKPKPEGECAKGPITSSNGVAADNEARANGIRCCAHLDRS